MAVTKRILCALLCLALGVAVALPAAAAEAITQADPNLNVPIFSQQPKMLSGAFVIRVGEALH